MAKIWPVYEGRAPTHGEAWADIPLSDAISFFELRQTDRVSDLDNIPRFGKIDRDLWLLGYQHIVVEISQKEARPTNWRAGFYHSRIKPKDAFDRLLQQALASQLGMDEVVRVEHEPATDSQGREALKITVVLSPEATKHLAEKGALSALMRVQQRLREMQEARTPIIEFATEAELVQDDGP